jgi:hypothetical protein
VVYQFKSEKDELFVLNTATMRWGIASSILATPSMAAAKENLARYVFSSEGTIVPMGAGGYSLDGRTEKDGIHVVAIMCVPFETYIVLYLRPNVNIKPDSFICGISEKHQEIIKYQIMQPNPEKMAQGGSDGKVAGSN